MDQPFPHPIRTEWKLLAILKKDNPGITNVECAKQLGVNENTIRHWFKSPLFQSYENWFLEKNWEYTPIDTKKARAAVQEELDEFAQEMLARLRDIVETSGDNKLVASIAFDALDRAGHIGPKREGQRPINFILTAEAVLELSRRAREIGTSEEVLVGQTVEAVG